MFKYKLRNYFKKIYPKITIWLSDFGLPLLLILFFLGTISIISFEIKYKDKFYPGIFIGDESISGKTYMEAFNYFKERAEKIQKEGIQIDFEGSNGIRTVIIPMSATGLTADTSVEYFTIGDWGNVLEEAYQLGRGTNIFYNLKDRISLFFTKKSFNFPATIQKEAVESLLDEELYGFFKKSTPAEFLLIGGKISISKEEVGENIKQEETIDILENKLAKLDSTKAIFESSVDMPRVTKANLEPFLGFAENVSKKINLAFQYQEHDWKLKGSKLATWLTAKENGTLGVDYAKLGEYFTNTVTKFINNPPQNSRFKILNGTVVEIVPGKSGNVVNIDNAIQKIEKNILENEQNFVRTKNIPYSTVYIPLETILIEPKITRSTIEEYHIKDLVGEIRTSFEGSSLDREHNIKIGVATINGMLIAPDTEFSTVSSIGHVSEKEGYKKELVIKKDRTVKEFGGGLCQIATTLFRLALNAGLPITERTNHRFVVHYYDPPGLDATIYGPHPDLRFVNDTGNYLLLQARVENKQVVMELYGQKDGRVAEVSRPTLYNQIPAPPTKYVPSGDYKTGEMKCFESPHDGVTTDALYAVSYPDGTIKTKNFKSIYQPWQKVCLIGTAL